MTFYAENETDNRFGFDWEEVYQQVSTAVLKSEGCPYEVEVSLILTDNEGIRQINLAGRGVDSPTDVLSFPNIDFYVPADFSRVEEGFADYFNPDTGELILGEIVISVEKVDEQAESFGHGRKREFAFLVAHSMLHLCGYDHMQAEDEMLMRSKQEEILNRMGITRD